MTIRKVYKIYEEVNGKLETPMYQGNSLFLHEYLTEFEAIDSIRKFLDDTDDLNNIEYVILPVIKISKYD